MILETVLPGVTGALVLALGLNAWRLLRGPALPDRMLALDTLYINALALLVLVGIRLDTRLYIDAALLIGLLGFIATVALTRFVLRRDIVE